MKKIKLLLAAFTTLLMMSTSAYAGTVLTYFYYDSNGNNVGVMSIYYDCGSFGSGEYTYGQITSNFRLDVQTC